MLTAAQQTALRTLATRGGSITCDTEVLSYARSATHCALLARGLVAVEVLRRYTRQVRRGSGPSSWYQTVSCTDIRVTMTNTGRAALA